MQKLIMLVLMLGLSGTSLWAAETPAPSAQELQEQFERIRNARNELEHQQQELDRQRQQLQHEREMMNMQAPPPRHLQILPKPLCVLMMVLCTVVHILVAVWVFQDIRNRGVGSGLWIVIALLAGLIGALVYAVVRIGDSKKS